MAPPPPYRLKRSIIASTARHGRTVPGAAHREGVDSRARSGPPAHRRLSLPQGRKRRRRGTGNEMMDVCCDEENHSTVLRVRGSLPKHASARCHRVIEQLSKCGASATRRVSGSRRDAGSLCLTGLWAPGKSPRPRGTDRPRSRFSPRYSPRSSPRDRKRADTPAGTSSRIRPP